jgi:hypothetical protein
MGDLNGQCVHHLFPQMPQYRQPKTLLSSVLILALALALALALFSITTTKILFQQFKIIHWFRVHIYDKINIYLDCYIKN